MGLSGLVVVAVVGLGAAEARDDTPGRDGVLVGGSAVVGGLGGAVVGGAAGVGLGALGCRLDNGSECWLPLLGGGLGAVGGGLGGSVLGAAWTTKRLDRDPRRVLRWGGLTIAGGAAAFGLGLAADVDALQYVGIYGTLAGVPVMTGIAAGTDPGARSLSLSPLTGQDGVQGLVLHGQF